MDGSSPDKVCCRDRGHSLPPISGKTMDSSRLWRLDGGLELLPGTWRECLGSDNCVPWEEAVPAVAAVAAATLPLASEAVCLRLGTGRWCTDCSATGRFKEFKDSLGLACSKFKSTISISTAFSKGTRARVSMRMRSLM